MSQWLLSQALDLTYSIYRFLWRIWPENISSRSSGTHRDRFVPGSRMIMHSATSPNLLKYSRSASEITIMFKVKTRPKPLKLSATVYGKCSPISVRSLKLTAVSGQQWVYWWPTTLGLPLTYPKTREKPVGKSITWKCSHMFQSASTCLLLKNKWKQCILYSVTSKIQRDCPLRCHCQCLPSSHIMTSLARLVWRISNKTAQPTTHSPKCEAYYGQMQSFDPTHNFTPMQSPLNLSTITENYGIKCCTRLQVSLYGRNWDSCSRNSHVRSSDLPPT